MENSIAALDLVPAGAATGGPQKIAVIAVHGVGSQKPYVTACELAGLLQRANPGTYTEFSESVLEIEVTKPRVKMPVAPAGKPKWYVRTRYARSKSTAAAPSIAEPDDLAFTRQALAEVEIGAELGRYHTRVLRGARSAGNDVRHVDIYEMYWADLSHLGGWLGQVLGQFYQLLFHLASLGQKTVELAWANGNRADRKHLTPALVAQTLVEWLLAGVLPIGNLALLLAVLPVSIALLPDDAAVRSAICAGVCGTIAGVLVVVSIYRATWRLLTKQPFSHPRIVRLAIAVSAVAALGALIGTAVGRWAYAVDVWLFTPSTFLFAIFSLISGTVFCWFGTRFARSRRYSNPHSGIAKFQERVSAPLVMMLVCICVWAALLWTGLSEFAGYDGDETIVYSTMRVLEGLFLLVEAAWLLFFASAWATLLSGSWAAAISTSARTKAAVWTGKVAMFVPATLFALVNLLILSVVVALIKKAIPNVEQYDSLYSYFGNWANAHLGCGARNNLHDCMDRLVEISASIGFDAFLIFLLTAIVLAVIAILPSIIHESRPTIGNDKDASTGLGNWLDSGFVVLRIAGYINLVGLLIVLPAVQILDWIDMGGWIKNILGPLAGSKALLYMTAVIIGAAGIGVVFRNALFDALGKALDIALDVDSWLRERPREHTPRGRILARYLSLLACVCDPKKGYTKLVIVSHSQGTVITADLLRFLKANPATVAAPLPGTTLLTFGSPLRQLYGLRFPHLYAWARDLEISPAVPDPVQLDVHQWVNGYRSGDYVGRFLWSHSNQWQPGDRPIATGTRASEFCIGAGAHTHYFDGTATVVGKVIDAAI